MLIGIPPVISPDLIKILMEMGHGDEIVIGDGNFPAASCAKRLVRCDGYGIPELLNAVLPLFPLDYTVEKPAALMAAPVEVEPPVIWKVYKEIMNKHVKDAKDFEFIERFAFYKRAGNAYAIVATGEKSRFANIILKKGIVIS